MQTLCDASQELFRRAPDETFKSLQDLWDRCQRDKEQSKDRWLPPREIEPTADAGRLGLRLEGEVHALNDWSFGQLCGLARVAKDTLNRLSPSTSAQALIETLPRSEKPLQVLTRDTAVRAVHGASYTRLYNTDLLAIVREFATDFQPPQTGVGEATGLYCGEQDMFCFLIDPTGWAEIDDQTFAPGFFLWNSEVGRRSIGVKTFWFQAVCQNHIVWDATEVIDYSRKHTANVHESLRDIREIIARLVEKRDARRDSFVKVIRKAMGETLAPDAEEALKLLQKHGVTKSLAKEATEVARAKGAFTIFAVVDALTRLSARLTYTGDRAAIDEKASSLLALAA